jgi:hypothetical protein
MNGRRGGRADRSQAKGTRLSVLSIPGSMSHCPKTFLGTELHLRSAFCKWQSRGLLNIWVRCGRKLAERDSLPDWSGGCGGDIIGSACASRAAPGERSGADCVLFLAQSGQAFRYCRRARLCMTMLRYHFARRPSTMRMYPGLPHIGRSAA